MPVYNAGLVLEGGGFKGIFTAGVLDFLIDKDIKFTSIYGVSAGACALCSYVSGQRHRVYDTFVDYADMKKFCSPQSLLLTGDLINADMSYHLIPDYLNPYDYVTAAKYPGKAYAVCTDIETGMPAYFQLDNIHENMPMIQASASMPLVSRNVRIGKHLYLDGGMSDAIPFLKSFQDGNVKSLVITTKKKDFRRKKAGMAMRTLFKMKYAGYPKLVERFENWDLEYNRSLDQMQEMEKKGQLMVIHPTNLYGVGRVEKDRERLDALYEEGYHTAEKMYCEMEGFFESLQV